MISSFKGTELNKTTKSAKNEGAKLVNCHIHFAHNLCAESDTTSPKLYILSENHRHKFYYLRTS